MSAIDTIWEGISNALLMAWTVWWALVLGFAISAVVQAWVPRERIQRALGGAGPRPVGLATALGAASSSCSYAAIAIARTLFARGASAASALAFQFASTNLVFELGIVIWVLLGWQFTVAELLGGLVLIAIMTAMLRLFVSRRLEAQARVHAQRLEAESHGSHQHDGGGAHHHSAAGPPGLRERLTSVAAWSQVAGNFRADWAMLYKEIIAGFFLSGFVALLGDDFFDALFLRHAPGAVRLLENVIVGPLIAVLSFVCSVGNIPLAAVLWSGGIGFAGVIAFVFADLITIPIVLAYRKYYGTRFTVRIVALMFVTIVLAALAITGLFAAAGLIPQARPARGAIFEPVGLDYRLFTNVLGLAIFAALFALRPRTAPEPQASTP
ncbi:MAG TPA: permease [Solirubrobacteraceae bacterium]|nr:permease [Solirubrobacteraceae bacterium]